MVLDDELAGGLNVQASAAEFSRSRIFVFPKDAEHKMFGIDPIVTESICLSGRAGQNSFPLRGHFDLVRCHLLFPKEGLRRCYLKG